MLIFMNMMNSQIDKTGILDVVEIKIFAQNFCFLLLAC